MVRWRRSADGDAYDLIEGTLIDRDADSCIVRLDFAEWSPVLP